MNLEPDGLLGAVVASESLGMTDTMVNGAGGCRSRSQIMVHDLIPAYSEEDRACCRSKYFSRQSRLPCTYLNNDDIVFGTAQKVSEGIDSVSGVTGRRTLLVDTLGASLVCTDYSGLTGIEGRDPILLDADLSGMGFAEGYDTAMRALLRSADIPCGKRGGVNLLGYGIADPGWEAGARELRDLLTPMGVEVNCIPGCLPTAGEIQSVGSAALNVMVRPEYCSLTASMLEERFGTPSLRPSDGAPIGYGATRGFVEEVADALGLDPTPSLERIDAEERSVRAVLMNYDRAPLGLHAKGFVAEGDSSTLYPLVKWMTGTFGMAPRRVTATDDAYSEDISSYLEKLGFSDALEGTGGEIEAVFCDGMTALEGRLSVTPTSYVEIRIPRGRHMDLMGRCLVGTRGCRYILDELFNNIVRFRCGQPTEVDYRPGCCDRASPALLRRRHARVDEHQGVDGEIEHLPVPADLAGVREDYADPGTVFGLQQFIQSIVLRMILPGLDLQRYGGQVGEIIYDEVDLPEPLVIGVVQRLSVRRELRRCIAFVDRSEIDASIIVPERLHVVAVEHPGQQPHVGHVQLQQIALS